MSDLAKLYQQTILQHDQAPRHASRLAQPTCSATGSNPLCGDRVALDLELQDGRVRDVGCEVRGCAICRASGSLLAEAVLGREVGEVQHLAQLFLAALAQPVPAPDVAGASGESLPGPLQPLAPLLEARRFPSRRRCASLCWEALTRALAP